MIRGKFLALAAIAASSLAGGASAQTPTSAAAGAAPGTAMGCVMCHGVNGQGSNGIPAIMKVQNAADFTTAMKLFAENKRAGTIMGRIARGYTADDVAELATWFAKP